MTFSFGHNFYLDSPIIGDAAVLVDLVSWQADLDQPELFLIGRS